MMSKSVRNSAMLLVAGGLALLLGCAGGGVAETKAGVSQSNTPRAEASPNNPARVGISPGNLAPDFGLVDGTGQTVRLSQFRGKPVVVNFWATWCPPCREEMPIIQKVFQNRSLSDRGLTILAVDIGEQPATVAAFVKSNGYTFTVLLDTQQIVAREYNIRAIPTTFFIDRDGIIKDVRVGAFASEAQMMASVNRIMG